jgi:hypothetical protein
MTDDADWDPYDQVIEENGLSAKAKNKCFTITCEHSPSHQYRSMPS